MSKYFSLTGLRWLWLTIIILIVDLVSKFLILKNFTFGETVSLFPSLNLHYVCNYGAAFSFLSECDGWQRWFLTIVAIVVSMLLVVLMYCSKATQKINNISYAFIFGGVLGNLFDRLWHGFVIDMIDFYIDNWHFPTFNIADSVICIGIALIMLEEFFRKCH